MHILCGRRLALWLRRRREHAKRVYVGLHQIIQRLENHAMSVKRPGIVESTGHDSYRVMPLAALRAHMTRVQMTVIHDLETLRRKCGLQQGTNTSNAVSAHLLAWSVLSSCSRPAVFTVIQTA